MPKLEYNPGMFVQFSDGRFGIIYKQDQFKTFRCGCCGTPVKKDGKALVTLTDRYMEHLDESKRLVNMEKTKYRVIGFV